MTLGEGCYILNDLCLYPRLWRGDVSVVNIHYMVLISKFKELNHLGMNLDLAFVFFFFTFYFEIILDFRKFAKIVQNSLHMSATYFTLVLATYITAVEY